MKRPKIIVSSFQEQKLKLRSQYTTMFKLLHLFALVLLTAAIGADSQMCGKAFRECMFRFEGSKNLQTFLIGLADNVPFTPQIVSRNPKMRIGILNSNSIQPEVLSGKFSRFFPITVFGNGFTPTQYKPFMIPSRMGSGIGHETFQGNIKVARQRCVRVFFTSYQLLTSSNPPMVTNVNLTPSQARSQKRCVVFMTK